MSARNDYLTPVTSHPEETDVSSSPSTPGPNEDEGDFFPVQKIESPLSSREGSQQPMVMRERPKYPIDSLPAELLILILGKLSSTQDLLNCLLVSRGWARCTVDLLWHRPLFTTWHRLGIIAESIRSLEPYFNYQQLIRRLNLSNLSEDVNDGTLHAFIGCKKIERLTLTGCRNLTDSGIKALVDGNEKLLALDVTGVTALTDDTILTLAKNCHRLQGLNITGCRHITDQSLVPLAHNCRFLKRLKLNRCTLVTDVAIEAFARKCGQMLEIDLQGCENVTDTSVSALMQCLMHPKGSLRELRLAQCNLISDNAFLALPSDLRCETLRILDLTACPNLTDLAVERIIDSAPRLRILVLAKCTEITDRAVYAITKLGKNLHDIHLGRCGHITDDALKELVKNCNRIRYIDLAGCVRVTDQSVKLLANLPKLRRIGLVKCQAITDSSIHALARSNASHEHKNLRERPTSSLERVHLSYCTNITIQGIHELLNSCRKLTHLSLTGIQEFFQREDILTFCREAPQEFNDEQRAVFCVFSGDGVNKLRDYLNEHEHNSYDHFSDSLSFDGDNMQEGQEVITGLMQNSALTGLEDFED